MRNIKINYVEESYRDSIICGIIAVILLFVATSVNPILDKIFFTLFFPLPFLGGCIYFFIKTSKNINKKNQIKKSEIKVQGKVVNIIKTNGMIKSAIKGVSDDDLAISSGTWGGLGNYKNKAFSTYTGGDEHPYYKLVIKYINPISNTTELFVTPYIRYYPKNWENLQCNVYIDDKGICADNYTTSM